MFSIDRWQETWESLNRHRFRTLITAMSVAWGIFMLVVLLGTGDGLQNAIYHQFRDDATNSIWVFAGETSLPFKGQAVGRQLTFTDADYEALSTWDRVDNSTGRFRRWTQSEMRYGDRHQSFGVRSVHADQREIGKINITSGRFLNDYDIDQKRKVVALGDEVAKFLFLDADPIGEWIEIGGLSYKVVGVFKDPGDVGEVRTVYIPMTTAQVAYNGVNSMAMITVTVGDATGAEATEIAEGFRQTLARSHRFDPDDPRALRIRNNLERFEQIQTTFALLRGFIWIVGIGTVCAGIVGVSNIMLVSVTERTREIGLRKALGATPASIIAMVMQEAVVLTSVSGYLGLVAGVAVLEVLIQFMPENDYIRDPQVHIGGALVAIGLLVFFGALAGFVPAARAARVRPIDALRTE